MHVEAERGWVVKQVDGGGLSGAGVVGIVASASAAVDPSLAEEEGIIVIIGGTARDIFLGRVATWGV